MDFINNHFKEITSFEFIIIHKICFYRNFGTVILTINFE